MSGRNYFLRIHAAGNKSGGLLLTICELINRRGDERLTIRRRGKRRPERHSASQRRPGAKRPAAQRDANPPLYTWEAAAV